MLLLFLVYFRVYAVLPNMMPVPEGYIDIYVKVRGQILITALKKKVVWYYASLLCLTYHLHECRKILDANIIGIKAVYSPLLHDC